MRPVRLAVCVVKRGMRAEKPDNPLSHLLSTGELSGLACVRMGFYFDRPALRLYRRVCLHLFLWDVLYDTIYGGVLACFSLLRCGLNCNSFVSKSSKRTA